MSKKIKDFLNILEQKDAYVEFNLSDNKDIKLILDEYFPDKGMFFYNELEIYCKEKNLNYEKIKNSKYPFLNHLYTVKNSISKTDTNILIGNLQDYYFSSSRGCAFSRNYSFIIPFAYYHYVNPNIIDLRKGEEMRIRIVKYDSFKIVSGGGCANHRLYGIYRGLNEFNNSTLLLNNLEITVYESINNDYTAYLRTYILPKISEGIFTINLLNNNLVFNITNSIVEFTIHSYDENPLKKPVTQQLLKVIEKTYKFFENNGINKPLIIIKNEEEKIINLIFSKSYRFDIILSLDDFKLFGESLEDIKFGVIASIRKVLNKHYIGNIINISKMQNIKEKKESIKYILKSLEKDKKNLSCISLH